MYFKDPHKLSALFSKTSLTITQKIQTEPPPMYHPDLSFYWATPDQKEIKVGYGTCLQLISEDLNAPLKHIQTLIHLIKKHTKDLPLLFFGGTAFHAAECLKKTPWAPFYQASMILPEYLYELKDGQWLVTHYQRSDQQPSATPQPSKKTFQAVTPSLIFQEQQTPLYMELIQKAKAQIQAGSFDKVVLARYIKAPLTQPSSYYQSVLFDHWLTYPAQGFRFWWQCQNTVFFGLSPELLIQKQGKHLHTMALAGTLNLTEDPNQLLKDPKNLSEHQYVVDFIKQQLLPNTHKLTVPDKPKVIKTPSVYHLYTPFKAISQGQTSVLDYINLLHPTPALGGMPQDKALQWIKQYEPFCRGYYAAPIGWVDQEGNGSFAVGIRSGLLSPNACYLYAGGGIVAQSDPQEEYQETRNKLATLLSMIGAR